MLEQSIRNSLQRNPMNIHAKHVWKRVWKWLKHLIGTWLICAILFGLYGWLFAWRTLDYYIPDGEPVEEALEQIMSGAEYASVVDTHARPFVVEMSLDTEGALLIFGAEHTKDPTDPQITEIEKKWQDFVPTFALCESRLGILFPLFMDPVRTFAEPGIENAFESMAVLQVAWDRQFPAGPDWRDVSNQYGLPGFMADMDTNLVRDHHF